ncbi:MAG: hypothetical protein GXY83_07555 [Rhodopirellula sp.]|nr:hypothetical protein [Rhodopirellula sp.]
MSAIALRPDGRHVALAACTGSVKVWDAASGKEVYTLQTHSALKPIGTEGNHRQFFLPMSMTRLAYSPDSRQMATSSDAVNAIIKLWDAENGNPLAALEGHTSLVTALAFSSDGKRLVSGSQDKTVRIWDVRSAKELIRFETAGSVCAVAISPDNRHVACSQFASVPSMTVRIWDAVKGDDLSFPRRVRSRGPDRGWTRSAYRPREVRKDKGPAPQPLSYEHLNQTGREEITLQLRVGQQEFPVPTPFFSHIPFLSKSQERLGGEPPYGSDRVRYATFKVGNGPDPIFTLAIDPMPGEPPVIYFDENNDEDLSNDGPGRWPDQFAGSEDRGQYIWNVAVDVPYATGMISQQIRFSLQGPVDAQRVGGLTWSLNACRGCTVESNGTQYRIVLADLSSDACFDDMNAGLVVLPASGFAPTIGPTPLSVSDPIELGGEKWKVVRLSADGTEMTLAPLREPAKPQALQPKAERGSPHAAAEARIAAALNEPAEAAFADVALAEVLATLAGKHQIPIVLEAKALADAGIAQDAPVTAKLTGTSLRTVLTVMLRWLDLTFLVDRGVVLVTTPQAEKRHMIRRTYPIADLCSPAELSRPGLVDYDSLIDLITSKVAPSSWEEVGGPGSIEPGRPDARPALTVRASYHVHEQLADCLEQLRCEMARKPDEQATAASRPPAADPGPSADDAAPNDRETTLEKALRAPLDLEFQNQPLAANVIPTLRKRFSINALVDNRALADAGIDPEPLISVAPKDVPLAEALDKILQPHHLAWTVDEGALAVFNTQEVHTQIAGLLADLRAAIERNRGADRE